ncbi:hypothetical protein GCM10009642_49030 [Nocardiopsis metallicus]
MVTAYSCCRLLTAGDAGPGLGETARIFGSGAVEGVLNVCQVALSLGSPSRRARTSDSRKRRCPPGVRMLLIRPEAAQRVTVLGSTRKSEATSPGVNRRSLARSTFTFPLIVPAWTEGAAGV